MISFGMLTSIPGALKSLLGIAKDPSNKSKVVIIGLVAVGVLVIWGWSKYDAYKIKKLELKNQGLTIERESALKSAEDINAAKKIDEVVVVKTLVEIRDLETETESIKSSVRDEIFNIQLEWEDVPSKEIIWNDYDPNTAVIKPIDTTIPTDMDNRIPSESIAIGDVEDQSDDCLQEDPCALDPRILNSIISGMWDNYCSEVEDNPECTERRSIDGGANSPST